MKKALLVIALVTLLIFAGCGQKAATDEKKAAATVQTAPELEEANQQFIGSDTVEIGEMI